MINCEIAELDIRYYLDSHPCSELPDAFVCDGDTIAVGALRAFTEHGYRVPEDISIIGFNGHTGNTLQKNPHWDKTPYAPVSRM